MKRQTILLGGASADLAFMLAHVSHFFVFFRIFSLSEVIMAFFLDFFWIFCDFCRFFMDFGWFSGGFWEVFSNFFAIFLEKANFLKYSIFLLEKP